MCLQYRYKEVLFYSCMVVHKPLLFIPAYGGELAGERLEQITLFTDDVKDFNSFFNLVRKYRMSLSQQPIYSVPVYDEKTLARLGNPSGFLPTPRFYHISRPVSDISFIAEAYGQDLQYKLTLAPFSAVRDEYARSNIAARAFQSEKPEEQYFAFVLTIAEPIIRYLEYREETKDIYYSRHEKKIQAKVRDQLFSRLHNWSDVVSKSTYTDPALELIQQLLDDTASLESKVVSILEFPFTYIPRQIASVNYFAQQKNVLEDKHK